MSVVNVRRVPLVKYIRKEGYNDLQDWMNDKNNIYIGRAGIVFIKNEKTGNKERFPKKSSPFYNPSKIGKHGNRDQVIEKYKNYILKKLEQSQELMNLLKSMKGKKLGCWCHPEKCHGDVLLELINKYT